MGKIKSDKANFVTVGEPMGPHQFEQIMKEAEKGPFYSMDKLKSFFEAWKAMKAKR